MAGKMQTIRQINRNKQKDAGCYRKMQEVTSLEYKLRQPVSVTITTIETVTQGCEGGEQGFLRCQADELADSRWAGSPGVPHQLGFMSHESHRLVATPIPQHSRYIPTLFFSIPSFLTSPSCILDVSY